jgi:4-hydroxybenzoate polyprenyltransferase
VLRGIRWSSLAVVLGAGALTLVCLVLALRGRPWAWLVGLVCAATAVREVRALQRHDRRARPARGPRA